MQGGGGLMREGGRICGTLRYLLVQALESSSTGKGGLIMSEGIKGELAMVGPTSTVPHSSKWQAPDWRKESKMKPRLHGAKRY